MTKRTKTTTPTANGNGAGASPVVGTQAPHAPIFPGTRFDENEFAMLRGVLKLYDDMIIQTRYDVAGQAVDEYIVDPLDIAMRLSGMNISTGPLPRNTLFYQLRDGQKRIGILVEPGVWTVNISGEKKPWKVPLPGLVFVGQGTDYGLWALRGNASGPRASDGNPKLGRDYWPYPETELFKAPCSNVSGSVCRGNVPFPVAAPDTIWQAWSLFIESEFNKHLDDGKSKRHPRAILDMWRELYKAKATEYPVEDLVSTGKTLAGVVSGD